MVAMGFFKKRAEDPSEIERIRAEIAAMGARLEAADADKARIGEQVQGIVTRLDTPSPPPAEPPPPPMPMIDPHELTDLRHDIKLLGERLDEIDLRITAISTELANQINEISGELEHLGTAAPTAEHVVDEMRDAQTRLANEQARYQIAFRQDLAELADRLRRS